MAIPGHQAIELGAEPQFALAFLIGSSLVGWRITITYGPMFFLVMGSHMFLSINNNKDEHECPLD